MVYGCASEHAKNVVSKGSPSKYECPQKVFWEKKLDASSARLLG